MKSFPEVAKTAVKWVPSGEHDQRTIEAGPVMEPTMWQDRRLGSERYLRPCEAIGESKALVNIRPGAVLCHLFLDNNHVTGLV